tara:strand:+ start:1417 stop:1788 length:372 start_codon:yes stop_codon:yes gene_type:complete
MSTLEHASPTQQAVLAKALLSASDQLGLKQAELASVLGVHRTAISRLKQKQSLDPSSKQGEIALFVIRIARALFALTGGDAEWIKHFMRTHNTVTGAVPAKQITSIQGLMTVAQFVDAIRGKL